MLPHGPRDSGGPCLDQLLSRLSCARGVWRLQAVGHRSRDAQDDARSLSTDEEPARQLFAQGAWILLADGGTAGMAARCQDRGTVMKMATRVSATQAALQLIHKLQAEHGPLLFHQSGGCCDGSSPMCFPRDEFQ